MRSLSKGVVTWSYDQYRSNARKEYEDFYKALFRELIQNSNDAYSTKIRFTVDDDNIICEDDGIGMDLDTITNKLLVIGGTKKDDVAVGGLGKAKELLFFSWPRWIIETNDHVIHGEGGEFEIFEADTSIKGTKVTLFIPKALTSATDEIKLKAVAVMRSCYISAELTLNGVVELPEHKLGRKVRHIPELGDIYHLKSSGGEVLEDYYIRVLINGTWMFDRWIGSHKGIIHLNIDSSTADVVELIAASRDSLKFKYAQLLEKVVQEIVVDKQSALRDRQRQPRVSVIHGTGEVYVPPTDEMLEEMAKALIQTQCSVDDMIDVLGNTNENVDLERERIRCIAKQALRAVDPMEFAIKYDTILNYEPDFIIFEDYSPGSWSSGRIKRFMKTQKASTIAQVWTETVKQVLWDNSISIRFTAGFIFSEDAEAMYRKNNGVEHFLINPRLVPPTGIQNKVYFMNYMRTTAVHEVTHRLHERHDEDFVSHYHALEARTWPSHRLYARIGSLR
jgi:hypothetical protein